MIAVLISIHPKQCTKIASRKKTVEVRKTRPKIKTPFKCYIYCTKQKIKNDELWSDARVEIIIENGEEHLQYVGDSPYYMNGRVIGEFVCNNILHSNENLFDESKITMQKLIRASGLTFDEINAYRCGKNIYAWNISDLKIYDTPKELGEFNYPCQKGFNDMSNHWCYRERGVRLTQCKYNDMVNRKCNNQVTRPPQSWCYVNELEV